MIISGRFRRIYCWNWTFGGGVDISVNRPSGKAASLTAGVRHFGAGTYLPLDPGTPAYQGLLVSVGMSTPSFPINLQVPLKEWQLQKFPDAYTPPQLPICLQKKSKSEK